jgi:membrane protein implicated in regulation of membrane protease activity
MIGGASAWLVLPVVFLAVEAATVTVVSLWFAAGSLAAMVTALTGGGLAFQAAVFLGVSAVMLTALRPLVRRYLTPKLTATNIDSVIGATGLVTSAIDNLTSSGQVKLNGMEWTARSTDGTPIPAGTRIRVDRIEGVKVFVSPLEVGAAL